MSEPEPEVKTNVVQFAPKREYVWEHHCHAKGQTFFLHRDGSVQCVDCKEYVDTLYWGHKR